MNTDYEELYRQRRERLDRATHLKEPDRVPVLENYGYFAARHAGITSHEFLFDYEKAGDAAAKTSLDFGYDTGGAMNTMGALPLALAILDERNGLMPSWVNGPVHDILGVRYARFPGRELAVDAPFQFIGEEYMRSDEYDQLIENPKRFIAEVIMPRSLRSLEEPGSAEANSALFRWGVEYRRNAEASAKLKQRLRNIGFGAFTDGISYAPLDLIGDFMRDIKNILLDCYRQPDNVKAAAESVMNLIVEMARISAKSSQPGTIHFIPLHLNEYFSPKQYGEFYWPTLKGVVNGLIKLGITPEIFYEGQHEAHLETILDLPKGKTISRFEKTDLVKAKKIIGDHTCIVGGPPGSLFLTTPTRVEAYVKELFQEVKQGGGFILSPVVPIPASSKPENVKALMDAVEKYGTYP
jgi:uroporphyrinogen-III decarboxylase